MTFMKLSVLLLAFMATTTYALDPNDPWECQHDHQERAAPQILEVDEEGWNPDGVDNSGRTLQSYNNLRIYGYYGLIGGGSFASYLENQLLPPIIDYWSAALKVKYPVSGLLKVPAGSCGYNIPTSLRNGVNADLVYLFSVDSSNGYIASSGACYMASGTNRPLVGHTIISEYFMSATSDVLLHERNMICIMHEFVHTFGWSNGIYNMWLDYQTGKRISNPTTTHSLDGYSAVVIQAEPIRTMVRNYFGCSSIAGAYMENTGSSGTAGTHFERRQYAYEAMTSGLIYQMQFSQLTLGMLESTGWYSPDYSYADPFFFGQGEGCSFLTNACPNVDSEFADLCTGSNRGCTTPGRGGGICGSDVRSDNCRFQQPQPDYDCDNSGAESYARLPSIQTFGRGSGAKCFTGTLSSGSAGSSTSFCFKFSCAGSGSGTELTVDIGGQSVLCTNKGAKTVSGYGGTINCPDPLTFCSTVGVKACPRNCMGRGTCINGKCACNSGASGEDCGLMA